MIGGNSLPKALSSRKFYGGLIVLAAGVAIAVVWAVVAQERSIRGPYRIGWETADTDQLRGSDRQPTGRVVELIREAARRRGVELQWIESPESSEAALRSGKVDLWPLVTITPERRKFLHFSAPYLDSVLSFWVLSGSRFQTLESLAHLQIGAVKLPINTVLVHRYLPDAQVVERKTAREVLDGLCNHEFDAMFLEQDEIVHELIRGGSACKDRGLALIAAPGPRVNYGIGSNARASKAADAIRDELDAMYSEGAMDQIFARWGYVSARSAGSVELLIESKRRERTIQLVAALLALSFFLAIWQTLRYRRQNSRAQRAEAAQRQSYAELLETQRLAGLGVWNWDVASGKVTWSEELYRISGLDPSEPAPDCLGRARMYTKESFARLRSALDEALKDGAPFQLDLEMIRTDSTSRSVTVRGEAIFDKNKRVTRLRGTLQDITQRKRMAEMLAVTEQRLQLALDAAALGTFEWNTLTGELIWDHHHERIFGFEPGAFDGTFASFEKTVHPDDLAQLLRVVEATRNSGTVFSHEYRIVWPDSTHRWILGRGAFQTADSQVPFRMHGVVIDITERRQLEAQLSQSQKMESVGRLAGGISHDFNNLLTVINGYCELILSDLPPDFAIAEQVEQIHRAGKRAAELTQQLLAFSRKQPAQPRLIDLNQLIAESKDLLQRLVGADVRLETKLPAGACDILADSGHIHQILMNLAVNARDAMPSGGELRIETQPVDAGINGMPEVRLGDGRKITSGAYVLLTVSDTGTGMDEETQRHVFEPFFTTKPQGKGTGLGLATVYGIVKQNKGWIEIYSQPNLGTDFRIYLPLAATGSNDIGPDAVDQTPKTISHGRNGAAETVLVVEDQDGLLNLVAGVLVSAGYQVLPAANGESALALAARHSGPIHLVLADVVMPGISGHALVEQLKLVRPEVRAVLMSGYSEELIAQRGILRPGDIYLPKPFTTASLIARLREVLSVGY